MLNLGRFQERQRNRAEEWSRHGHMFQWKVAFIRQKFSRRPLAGTEARSIIDFVLASASEKISRKFVGPERHVSLLTFLFFFFAFIAGTASCRVFYDPHIKNQTFFLCFINNIMEWWLCRLRCWKRCFVRYKFRTRKTDRESEDIFMWMENFSFNKYIEVYA